MGTCSCQSWRTPQAPQRASQRAAARKSRQNSRVCATSVQKLSCPQIRRQLVCKMRRDACATIPLMTSPNSAYVVRDLAHVWHPCTQMKDHEQLPLIPIRRGRGAWLEDYSGARYLDAISSWWVNLFGHANARINAAVREQLEELEQVILAGFTHEPVIALSEALSALAPAGLTRCFYADNGSSAVEVAVKMSFHYWRNVGVPRSVASSPCRTATTARPWGRSPWATSISTRRSTARCSWRSSPCPRRIASRAPPARAGRTTRGASSRTCRPRSRSMRMRPAR